MSVFDSERALETSEAVAAQQQDAAIAQIRAGLEAGSADDCVSCGEPIGEARRAALPSAIRCVGCQARVERIRQLREEFLGVRTPPAP